MARPKKETLEHRKAFDLYLSMGADRTLLEVSRRASKSEGTIKAWSLAFNWQDRIQDAEKRIADKASAKVEETLAQFNAKRVNIADAVIGLFVKRLRTAVDENGDLRPRGYKPSALDAKIWADMKAELISGSDGEDDGGLRIDAAAVEQLGAERIERIIFERVTRLARARKRRAEGGGDLGVGI